MTIEICRWTVSVVYGTMANVAGAAIQNFRIGPSLSNQIESRRPIRIRISKLICTPDPSHESWVKSKRRGFDPNEVMMGIFETGSNPYSWP